MGTLNSLTIQRTNSRSATNGADRQTLPGAEFRPVCGAPLRLASIAASSEFMAAVSQMAEWEFRRLQLRRWVI